jgi:uncharacterized FlgJ-related protein
VLVKKHKAKIYLVCIISVIVHINILGCAEMQKKAEYYWGKIKYQFSDKQTGSRDKAVQKYDQKGGQDKLIVETPVITPKVASPGQKIKQELQYALICTQQDKRLTVSEAVSISTGKDTIELTRRESIKAQGIHESIIEIAIPKDLSAGEYKLITTLSTGDQRKKVSGSFRVTR